MEQGFDYSQEMRQWVSPSLIEANYILSLSQQELQAVIEQELLSNPALEIEDRATCPAAAPPSKDLVPHLPHGSGSLVERHPDAATTSSEGREPSPA